MGRPGRRITVSAEAEYPHRVERHVPLYAAAYAGFSARDHVRRETYGDDLGQSGWLTVDELERFAGALRLRAGSRLLDVGCGSGGPALHLAETVGPTVCGVDVLGEAIVTARQLAAERGLDDRASFLEIDAGDRLPFADASFDTVLSTDAMCHLPNRLDVLREWHRITSPGARILFTDPTILTGLVTGEELAARSSIGVYVFSVASANGGPAGRGGLHPPPLRGPDGEPGDDGSPLARRSRALPRGVGGRRGRVDLRGSAALPLDVPAARARATPIEVRLPGVAVTERRRTRPCVTGRYAARGYATAAFTDST
jgi:SAM-dependent methyltransferase